MIRRGGRNFAAAISPSWPAKARRGKPIREAARRGNVTLLYSARDEKHNNALALKDLS